MVTITGLSDCGGTAMKQVQLLRAKSVAAYNSPSMMVVRIITYFVGLIGVTILLTSFYIDESPMLISLALLLITPGVLFLGYGWYIGYLEDNPAYGLTAKDLELPQNRLDFPSLLAIQELKKHGWGSFWEVVSKNHAALELLLRLTLSSETLERTFSAIVADKKLADELTVTIGNSIPNSKVGSIFDLLKVVLRRNELIQHFTNERISPEEIDQLIEFYHQRHYRLTERQMYWLHPELNRTGGFAADWALSYTNVLDQYTTSVTPSIKFHTEHSPLLSRVGIVDQIIAELQKDSNHNILLVGEEGIGRREIFLHVADKVLHYQTKTDLDGTIVKILDISKIIAATNSKSQLQQLLDQVFNEITRSGRIILFIDPLELLVSPSEKVGTLDLTQLLSSYLQEPRVHIVATALPETFVTQIKSNSALQSLWTKIDVPSPTPSDLPLITLSNIGRVEAKYGCFFAYDAVRAISQLSGKYLTDLPSPQRELMIVEEVASRSHSLDHRLITETEVIETIEQKSGVPIAVKEEEKSELQNLPQLLHQRVVGQDFAITQISDALLRARAGLSNSTKPIGTFLFMGPTGVGKTETAKTLADVYFKSDKKLIRLDMSEYAGTDGLEKLLGSDPKTKPGSLTVALQSNPSAVLLLDEFEKAHSLVRNAFLQVLDEGRLTTNYGKVLNFTNTIIIATSNAGSDFIKQQIDTGQKVSELKNQLLDQLMTQKIFAPELLNRFDTVAVYSPLSIAEIEQIAMSRISELTEKISKEKGIKVNISQQVIQEVAKRGYDPVFGARALDRVIKNDLETVIAKQIIADMPKPGAILTVSSI